MAEPTDSPPQNDTANEDLGEDISTEQNGGLYKKILREGTGEFTSPPGNKVVVHYVGRLTDGTIFDSSRERSEPFEFSLGDGNVIKGWDVGVATMKKGEMALLTCSPEYGYGEKGSSPKIPPNATLKFEVEVLDWKAEDVTDDGGVKKVVLKKGEGYQNPNDQAEVKVHIIGKYEGRTFEDRHVEFHLGSGEDFGVVEGIELALEKMAKDEKSLLTVKPKYAYGSTGSSKHDIPADAVLEYVVHLTDFVKGKDIYSMDLEEKLEASKSAKEKGNGFFKSGAYSRALKEYKRIDKIADSLYEDKEKEDIKPIQLAGFLNIAACHLKLGNHFEAAKACDTAIGIDSDNVKAHFRRGQARLVLQDFDDAKADFKKVIQLDPKNKAARDQLVVVNQRTAQVIAKERRLYTRMFQKLAKEEEEAPAAAAPEPAANTNKDEGKKDEGKKDEETKDEEKKDEETKDEEKKDEETKDEEKKDEETKDEEKKDEQPAVGTVEA